MLSDSELMRYSRHIVLSGFDIQGQEALKSARVLILGLGGLGSPAALYLAAAGVGELLLADGDEVELSNLQRQIAHGEADIGVNKACSAAASIAALNSEVSSRAIARSLVEEDFSELLSGVSVALDCSDNSATRHALNRACIAAGVPLIAAAAVRGEGQLALFDPMRGGPCYRCLYPQAGDDSQLSCSESGVLAPLLGVMGSLQAASAINFLTGYGRSTRGELTLVDLRSMEFRRLGVPRLEGCPDCGHCPD